MAAARKIPAVRVCIAGGGPAGMMLGFLLARGGIETAVLKWPDFFRDFRGDTIHPSTMDVLHELGILPEFLKLPHDETRQVKALIGNEELIVADFSHLPVRCPFIAFIPQWEFLNFIAAQAKRYPAFHLLLQTEVTDLVKDEDGRIAGVQAHTPDGPVEIRAELVIGADGRHSTVREKSSLASDDLGAPMDVLWFRLSRQESDPEQSLGRLNEGRMMIMLNRSSYWQCGFVIRKGEFEDMQRAGLPAFREGIDRLAPYMGDRASEVKDWNDVKLLSVKVDHLRQWSRPGLLCIGDAAHAMSPIGGVGINLAIQDAVAAANILVPKLRAGPIALSDLQAVERRRRLPTRLTQRLQVLIQNRVITRVLQSRGTMSPPWQMRLLNRFPVLRRIPARIIGMGFRPEHINP